MKIKILDQVYDEVIKCKYITTSISYLDAINELCPLMDKLDFQRNPLRKTFYQRLEQDILNGCIMPNITIAIKVETAIDSNLFVDEKYINNNLQNAFILDGIQRLNTLQRVSTESKFPNERVLYCNILICNSMDRLLYRMITLNNGQKPMTARHQIEILAANMFDFESLAILAISEKERGKTRSIQQDTLKKETLIKGYLAYVSGSINIDNQKIIEEKMNEIIAEEIMESNITQKDNEFKDVINHIDSMFDNEKLKDWFNVQNNFIAYCASMNSSYDILINISLTDMVEKIDLFETAFSGIDVSKIKLGQARRKAVYKYLTNIHRLGELSVNKLIDYISQEI